MAGGHGHDIVVGTTSDVALLETNSKMQPNHIPQRVVDESPEAQMRAVAEALKATSADARQLINRLRTQIPIYTEEGAYANAGAEEIVLDSYSNNLILVNTISFSGPVGCTTLTLQLGDRKFKFTNPVTAGYLSNVEFVIKPQEVRKLTWAPAAVGEGDVFLWLLGKQLPEVQN